MIAWRKDLIFFEFEVQAAKLRDPVYREEIDQMIMVKEDTFKNTNKDPTIQVK